MIRVLTLPADRTAPHSLTQMSPTDLRGFQHLVGGSIEGVDLPYSGSLYANEDGIALRLPLNERATALVAFHTSLFTREQVIVGDVYLTGPGDAQGLDTDVPDTIVQLLTASPIQLQASENGGDWTDHGAYPDLVDAYTSVWAASMLLTHFEPGKRFAVRAVPAVTAAEQPTGSSAGTGPDEEAVWTVWGDRVDPYAVRQPREQAQAAVDTATAEGDTGVYAQHPDGTTLTPTPTQ
ncbi:DUF3846 domain-containing protein [Parafrankia discariae]|uniref:DUF3846 domain-containing protein n=1 Tax=Parafrankia discariae TaxID=365528 RepID=UPI000360D3ED|nr:DUF3846 domain-containing protein [Parafrankia discariae]